MSAVSRLRNEVGSQRAEKQLEGVYKSKYGSACPYLSSSPNRRRTQTRAATPPARFKPSVQTRNSPLARSEHALHRKRLRDAAPGSRAQTHEPPSLDVGTMVDQEAVENIQNILSTLAHKYRTRKQPISPIPVPSARRCASDRGRYDSPSYKAPIAQPISTPMDTVSPDTISRRPLSSFAPADQFLANFTPFLRRTRPQTAGPVSTMTILPEDQLVISPPIFPQARPTGSSHQPSPLAGSSTPSSPVKKRSKPVFQAHERRTAPPVKSESFDENVAKSAPVRNRENEEWLENIRANGRAEQTRPGAGSVLVFNSKAEASERPPSCLNSALLQQLKASTSKMLKSNRVHTKDVARIGTRHEDQAFEDGNLFGETRNTEETHTVKAHQADPRAYMLSSIQQTSFECAQDAVESTTPSGSRLTPRTPMEVTPRSPFAINLKEALEQGRRKLKAVRPRSSERKAGRQGAEGDRDDDDDDARERDGLWEELGILVKRFLLDVDESSIQKQQLLGRGKWGAVYRATYRQQLEDGQSVSKATALKEAQYNITKSKPPLSCLKEFMREIKMLTAVQHSHITAIEGVVMQPQLSVLLELMEAGSLAQNIAQTQRWINVCVCVKLKILLDVARALACLHRHNIAHRDVKAHNVLLKTDKQNRLYAKLADFGTAVIADRTRLCYEVTGTTGYTAPEVYIGEGYTFTCDVFGYATLAWDVFSVTAPPHYQPTVCKCNGSPSREKAKIEPSNNSCKYLNPLTGLEAEKYLEKLRAGCRPPLHEGIPAHLCSLLSSCWSTVPGERPSMDSLSFQLRRLIADVNGVLPLSPSPRRSRKTFRAASGFANIGPTDSERDSGITL